MLSLPARACQRRPTGLLAEQCVRGALQTDGTVVRISRADCLTDRGALHTSGWLTIMLAEAEGDKMTPPAKFAAVTAAARFGRQRSG